MNNITGNANNANARLFGTRLNTARIEAIQEKFQEYLRDHSEDQSLWVPALWERTELGLSSLEALENSKSFLVLLEDYDAYDLDLASVPSEITRLLTIPKQADSESVFINAYNFLSQSVPIDDIVVLVNEQLALDLELSRYIAKDMTALVEEWFYEANANNPTIALIVVATIMFVRFLRGGTLETTLLEQRMGFGITRWLPLQVLLSRPTHQSYGITDSLDDTMVRMQQFMSDPLAIGAYLNCCMAQGVFQDCLAEYLPSYPTSGDPKLSTLAPGDFFVDSFYGVQTFAALRHVLSSLSKSATYMDVDGEDMASRANFALFVDHVARIDYAKNARLRQTSTAAEYEALPLDPLDVYKGIVLTNRSFMRFVKSITNLDFFGRADSNIFKSGDTQVLASANNNISSLVFYTKQYTSLLQSTKHDRRPPLDFVHPQLALRDQYGRACNLASIFVVGRQLEEIMRANERQLTFRAWHLSQRVCIISVLMKACQLMSPELQPYDIVHDIKDRYPTHLVVPPTLFLSLCARWLLRTYFPNYNTGLVQDSALAKEHVLRHIFTMRLDYDARKQLYKGPQQYPPAYISLLKGDQEYVGSLRLVVNDQNGRVLRHLRPNNEQMLFWTQRRFLGVAETMRLSFENMQRLPATESGSSPNEFPRFTAEFARIVDMGASQEKSPNSMTDMIAAGIPLGYQKTITLTSIEGIQTLALALRDPRAFPVEAFPFVSHVLFTRYYNRIAVMTGGWNRQSPLLGMSYGAPDYKQNTMYSALHDDRGILPLVRETIRTLGLIYYSDNTLFGFISPMLHYDRASENIYNNMPGSHGITEKMHRLKDSIGTFFAQVFFSLFKGKVGNFGNSTADGILKKSHPCHIQKNNIDFVSLIDALCSVILARRFDTTVTADLVSIKTGIQHSERDLQFVNGISNKSYKNVIQGAFALQMLLHARHLFSEYRIMPLVPIIVGAMIQSGLTNVRHTQMMRNPSDGDHLRTIDTYFDSVLIPSLAAFQRQISLRISKAYAIMQTPGGLLTPREQIYLPGPQSLINTFNVDNDDSKLFQMLQEIFLGLSCQMGAFTLNDGTEVRPAPVVIDIECGDRLMYWPPLCLTRLHVPDPNKADLKTTPFSVLNDGLASLLFVMTRVLRLAHLESDDDLMEPMLDAEQFSNKYTGMARALLKRAPGFQPALRFVDEGRMVVPPISIAELIVQRSIQDPNVNFYQVMRALKACKNYWGSYKNAFNCVYFNPFASLAYYYDELHTNLDFANLAQEVEAMSPQERVESRRYDIDESDAETQESIRQTIDAVLIEVLWEQIMLVDREKQWCDDLPQQVISNENMINIYLDEPFDEETYA